MFGAGSYLAQYLSKADQYSDESADRICHAFICRAQLGKYYVTKRSFSQKGQTNPRPIRRMESIPEVADNNLNVHSVLAETGVHLKKYREFVFFDKDLILPEFHITYKRVNANPLPQKNMFSPFKKLLNMK